MEATKDKDKTLGRKKWLCAWVGKKRKKKEKKGMEGKRGGGRKRVGSKVFVFWQNFAKF
jgi:hypothetical protein